jgi:hypothetical protein
VFPARYELNSYTVFRKRLVSKRLTKLSAALSSLSQLDIHMFCPVSIKSSHSQIRSCVTRLVEEFHKPHDTANYSNGQVRMVNSRAASRIRPVSICFFFKFLTLL